MSMNDTPKADRVHIGIFGRRNVGKSSLINAVTNQNISIVSDIKGTTTDPVYKAMEILPLGAVVLIDTAGLDDEGELGKMRVKKAIQILNKTDIAVVVADSELGLGEYEKELIEKIEDKKIPYIVVMNKADKTDKRQDGFIYTSTVDMTGIEELKEKIAHLMPQENKLRLVGDIINEGDTVVLVVPIDASAPKGRLILPQQQAIRDILESGAVSVVCRDSELKQTLERLKEKPQLVICDSQAFERVDRETPEDIPLTSFSMLFARYKGNLEELARGAKAVENLKDGDIVLISEGCTHHRQCEDIGTVKIPKWLKEYTGKNITFETSSGTEFPEDIEKYSLIIHCGGCMLNEREVKYRIKCATDMNVPIVNYGIFISYVKGILERSIKPLLKK